MKMMHAFFLLLLCPALFAALPVNPDIPCPSSQSAPNYTACADSCSGYHQACDISACERACRSRFCTAGGGERQVCMMNLCLDVDDRCYQACSDSFSSCSLPPANCSAEKEACDARCPGEVEECIDSCLEETGKWACNGLEPEQSAEPPLNISIEESGVVSAEESTCGMAFVLLLLPAFCFLGKK